MCSLGIAVFLFPFHFAQSELVEGEEHEHSITSKINLVDLAGSERCNSAMTSGDRLRVHAPNQQNALDRSTLENLFPFFILTFWKLNNTLKNEPCGSIAINEWFGRAVESSRPSSANLCLSSIWLLGLKGNTALLANRILFFVMQTPTGGRKHQQILTDSWEGHLCPVRASAVPEEGLHSIPRIRPDMVRDRRG